MDKKSSFPTESVATKETRTQNHSALLYKNKLSAYQNCQGCFCDSALPVTVYMPARLQCLDVPIVDDEACQNAYPDMITRRMVCAGYMDGGRDACNVSFEVNPSKDRPDSELCMCVRIHSCSRCVFVTVRVTPAALWCVSESSTAWCHGVRDAPCPTTPESMSKCASSSTGFKTLWQPTPKEITHFSLNFSPSLLIFFIYSLPYMNFYSYFLIQPRLYLVFFKSLLLPPLMFSPLNIQNISTEHKPKKIKPFDLYSHFICLFIFSGQ